ncbi:transmembrane protein, putative [Bodo saltans]|uniref:Transmembrane protein, putative n=1 Tax=Bodo saltans TaxID=75058 RepID=A0A0S4JAP0_BODSA|nr:transmembrane protein, putative [Bodo saltans]|eukprot:CUG88582.1 transmembrane protein, putative [Bodo saltans]
MYGDSQGLVPKRTREESDKRKLDPIAVAACVDMVMLIRLVLSFLWDRLWCALRKKGAHHLECLFITALQPISHDIAIMCRGDGQKKKKKTIRPPEAPVPTAGAAPR